MTTRPFAPRTISDARTLRAKHLSRLLCVLGRKAARRIAGPTGGLAAAPAMLRVPAR